MIRVVSRGFWEEGASGWVGEGGGSVVFGYREY